jgi:hypothetical protein
MIPKERVDESALTPMFLASLSDLELVMLQHELRQHPEDWQYVQAVLKELGRRQRVRG